MLIAVPTNVLLIAYFTNTRIFTYILKKTISKIIFVYVYKSVFIFIEQKKKCLSPLGAGGQNQKQTFNEKQISLNGSVLLQESTMDKSLQSCINKYYEQEHG